MNQLCSESRRLAFQAGWYLVLMVQRKPCEKSSHQVKMLLQDQRTKLAQATSHLGLRPMMNSCCKQTLNIFREQMQKLHRIC
jgi:hypothetical protein